MAGQGVQNVPIRYPREMPPWMSRWFDEMWREVFRHMDVRNAIPGVGIDISGQSSEPATISASEDLGELFDADFALAEATPLLPNARVLAGEENVVEVLDSGPGGELRVSIILNGLQPEKLAAFPRYSVLGNPTDANATGDYIRAMTDDVVLRRVGGVMGFGKVTPDMIDPPITSRYLQPVTNGDGDSPELLFDDTGDLVFADAETF